MKYFINLTLLLFVMISCNQTSDTSAFDEGLAKFENNKALTDKTFDLFIAKDLDGMMDMYADDAIWSPANTLDSLSKESGDTAMGKGLKLPLVISTSIKAKEFKGIKKNNIIKYLKNIIILQAFL